MTNYEQKILIVDDEPMITQLLDLKLSNKVTIVKTWLSDHQKHCRETRRQVWSTSFFQKCLDRGTQCISGGKDKCFNRLGAFSF